MIHRRFSRAFTLLELLVALMLIAAIAAGGFSLFRGAWSTRERLVADSRRALEVSTLESVLRQAVLSSEAGSDAGDFAISSRSLSIPCRVLRMSSGAERRGGHARRFSIFFDEQQGSLLASWDDEPAVAILQGLSSASFRAFDGRTWMEDFSAARDGGLPLAVELSLRWRRPGDPAATAVGADSSIDAVDGAEGPVDAIVAVAVPDAAPEADDDAGGRS